MGNSRCLVAVLAAVMLTGSCNPFKRKPAPAPPVTVVKPTPREPEPAPAEEPKEMPAPPTIEPPATAVPSALPSVQQPNVEPPPPESSTGSAAPAPATGGQGLPVGPVDVPQLTQLLSREEIVRYNREIDANLGAIQKLVDEVSRRRLNEQQAVALDRIRTLARQATDMRTADLETARGLAARALVLARDLASSTR